MHSICAKIFLIYGSFRSEAFFEPVKEGLSRRRSLTESLHLLKYLHRLCVCMLLSSFCFMFYSSSAWGLFSSSVVLVSWTIFVSDRYLLTFLTLSSQRDTMVMTHALWNIPLIWKPVRYSTLQYKIVIFC